MKKIILTDADGVLVNWDRGFTQFMENKGYPRLPNTDHEYSISNRHTVSHHEAMQLVKEFNESDQIANLDAFADSVEYVGRLAALGFRFIVVTSISSHPTAAENRIKNLKSLFGDIFDEIHCIEQGASKASILAEKWAGAGYFWIEDHMRQAEAGHEAGLKTILIDHPYNCHYQTDLFPKVSHQTPWREIYEKVCSEYNIYIHANA